MDWRGVGYLRIIVMFLSAVWILILTAPIHCSASIAEQVMDSKSVLMKKQTLHLGYLFLYVQQDCTLVMCDQASISEYL